MIPALIAAAIAGIGSLKSNDDKKRQHQEAINAAEQEMWDKRNADIQARIDAANGIDPRRNAFANQLSAFHGAVGDMPVQQDWMPLVQAGGQMASAIYGGAQKGMFDGKNMHPPAAPSGEDIPGRNFSAAPGSHVGPVNYAEWQPVEHRGSNVFDRARETERLDAGIGDGYVWAPNRGRSR